MRSSSAAIRNWQKPRRLFARRNMFECPPIFSAIRPRNRRPALAELIKDVQSGNTDFEHILVYDVSRWGRFQDVDESAHYEFVCRRSGIKVAYCAEQFDNDGSLLSSIVKNIK